jgi:hypothetical protein
LLIELPFLMDDWPLFVVPGQGQTVRINHGVPH